MQGTYREPPRVLDAKESPAPASTLQRPGPEELSQGGYLTRATGAPSGVNPAPPPCAGSEELGASATPELPPVEVEVVDVVDVVVLAVVAAGYCWVSVSGLANVATASPPAPVDVVPETLLTSAVVVVGVGGSGSGRSIAPQANGISTSIIQYIRFTMTSPMRKHTSPMRKHGCNRRAVAKRRKTQRSSPNSVRAS
jgi:hypothetical protein